MGFFDKISKAFEKKNCDICGAEIGLFGNNKLADANMCNQCAGKLSPFFKDHRRTTKDDIIKQMEYRERNKGTVESFHPTRTLGKDNMKVLIDEDKNQFVVIPSGSDWRKNNPDVLSIAQVTGVNIDVDETEHREEIKRKNPKGEMVSFNPPRYEYEYSYDVFVILDVEHEYFHEIRVRVNRSSISTKRRNNSAELDNCRQIAEDIQRVLSTARDNARVAANTVVQAVTCPWCGATTTPDASGCCEYCGGSVKG